MCLDVFCGPGCASAKMYIWLIHENSFANLASFPSLEAAICKMWLSENIPRHPASFAIGNVSWINIAILKNFPIAVAVVSNM